MARDIAGMKLYHHNDSRPSPALYQLSILDVFSSAHLLLYNKSFRFGVTAYMVM